MKSGTSGNSLECGKLVGSGVYCSLPYLPMLVLAVWAICWIQRLSKLVTVCHPSSQIERFDDGFRLMPYVAHGASTALLSH